jgi:hypothetical protein
MIGSSSVDNPRPAAIVGGYWTVGDGGGGLFFWDKSSTSGDDGVSSTQPGTIIVPTGSTSGRWVRLYSGEINVKWFGARGQGTEVDDAPAINKAISVAGALQAAVFIPRGIYRLDAALVMSFPGMRLHGEKDATTFLDKVGNSADTIVFSRTSNACQVADLQIRPRGAVHQTSGAAIRFSEPIGVAWMKLSDLWITAFQGIAVEGSGFKRGIESSISNVTIDRVYINYYSKGIKMCYSINWTVQNIVLLSKPESPAPGSNLYGVWIDTETEGCYFNNIYSLGGEHSWRIARSINTESIDRGPSEDRFYHCIGDNGSVSCMYISSLHRGLFTNCWCSVQKETSNAAVVLDSLDIWGVRWDSSQIVNTTGVGIHVIAAVSFAITNSTFSEWDLANINSPAIRINPNPRTNFSIIGNQFIRDLDFGNHFGNKTIFVIPGTYNRYIISNNMSYNGTDASNMGAGQLRPIEDLGTALNGKIVNNNLY